MKRVSVAWLVATGTLISGSLLRSRHRITEQNWESELDRLEREIQAE